MERRNDDRGRGGASETSRARRGLRLAGGVALSAVVAAACVSAEDGEWSSKARSSSSSRDTVTSQPIPTRNEPSAQSAAAPAQPTQREAVPSQPSTAAPSEDRSIAATASDDVPEEPRPMPPQRPDAVDPSSLRAAAMTTLDAASRSTSPLMRAHAIEALSPNAAALDAAASRGLVDDNRGVRFVAAMAIARAKRCEISYLVEPLLRDASDSVRAAAIAAVAVCGRPVDQSPFASMVTSPSTEVRANAYWAIGLIGNASAIGMVRESVGQGLALTDPVRVRIVELQAAECLVRLGELQEIEPIRAALFAPVEQGELTALACQMVGRLNDERAKPMLERLLNASGDQARPPEIRIAAVDALGHLGGSDPAVLLSIIEPYVGTPQASVRAQTATALGAIGSQAALPYLSHLLGDREPVVQVAAAGAILVLTKTP